MVQEILSNEEQQQPRSATASSGQHVNSGIQQDGVERKKISKKQDQGHIPKWRLFLVSCTIYATQFSYAAATAYVIPIFFKLQMSMSYASMIWAISPILCLLLQPKVAILSNRCNSRLGRRKPFVFVFAVGVSLGLIFIANGETIGLHATTDNDHYHPWGIFFTALGVVLTDFCTDTCQIATRSYMLDVTPASQRQFAINLFAIVAGFGSCLAYLISAINWSETLEGQIQVVFNIATVMFVVCTILTMASMQEKVMNRWSNCFCGENDPNAFINHSYQQLKTEEQQANEEDKLKSNFKSVRKTSHQHSGNDNVLTADDDDYDDDNESFDAVTDQDIEDSQPITFCLILKSFGSMPRPLLLLCLTQFFGWSAFVSYQLFFTQYVGKVIYLHGQDSYTHIQDLDLTYNVTNGNLKAGIEIGSWGLLLHFISYSLLAFGMKFFINLLDIRVVYILSQLIFAISMAIIGFIGNTVSVLVLSGISGIHLAALISLPFILVSNYQSSINTKSSEKETLGGDKSFFIPQWRIDLFIAALTSLAYVAQAVVCLVLGAIIVASGSYNAIIISSAALATASTICSIILAIDISPKCCTRYKEFDDFLPTYSR